MEAAAPAAAAETAEGVMERGNFLSKIMDEQIVGVSVREIASNNPKPAFVGFSKVLEGEFGNNMSSSDRRPLADIQLLLVLWNATSPTFFDLQSGIH